MAEEKFMLIDGNSLLYRAFYALPLLHNSAGVYTNGVYGFLTMFNRVLAELQPTHIAVAFDKDRSTFRNELYSEYKANRSAPPDELGGQFQLLRDVLAALNVEFLEMQGYEADDIIGTLSKKAEAEGLNTVILTGDGDVLQLVSDKVEVLLTKKGISEMEFYDPQGVKDKWGVEPEKMVEIKGLMGDASDNIPGVPGVGPKTAIKLVREFASLENLFENLPQVKGKKLIEKLEQNREQAFLSRQLATINREMDLDFQIEDYALREPHYPELMALYRSLEFNNFLKALQEKERGIAPVSEGIEVLLLEREEEVLTLLEEMKEGESVALYLQSNYHHPMWARLQGVFLEIGQRVYQLKLEVEEDHKLQWLKALLESATIKKYLHNAKFLQVFLLRHGIELRGVAGDTMLLAYVDDPVFEGEELDACLQKYLQLNIAENNPAALVSRIKELFFKLEEQVPAELRELLQQVEMPMSEVLARMEFCGVKVERSTLARISDELASGIASNEERIFELAGSSFNINSPKQLGKVLFEDLGLRVIKRGKTGYSTGVEVLEKLYQEHEIIPYILNYRQLSKIKSTYTDALQELIHPETGRIHTIFKQAQTATGRLSSVEPNLQNIPIRMEEGRRIRQAFVAPGPEWLVMAADYSQIDLRSLAHISGDERLIETFKSGVDIHTRTAAEIFHLPVEWVDSELRRRAKAVNFGIIYGISDFGLARDTGVSRKEARKYIDNYLNSYPGVKKYMEDVVEFGRRHGYVETLLKRRRYLPELNARNKMVQAFARRMALNTPVQGTSADIIKLAMIKVDEEIRERQLQARLLLQVHDELVLELPRAELEEVARLLRDCMENACSLKVPLEVSLNTGPNWYEME
ncbi:MAG: DNA polymerase I [Syntrophomonas sp.]|uniref:DNA polymerase I n=1 Tax=Syntrophomonas sp. TaxID=2053627 RepID=UPI002615AF6D|nr:DNA polymerase I [Syntrophomonas sp.]MDD2509882.1 DNA polymerase I [Syntrophomonas sp.]MDD3878573.1 DNA polymerase I [Syntrophomonas sp.]MDD4626200.1 DNA polymerase I [Syntrophomonas sp.]